ncbi:MAG: hypothetical protein K6G30_00625 [Acetatifactor sp.]|nr:hypothetical protein [Acetatifactor sp.]
MRSLKKNEQKLWYSTYADQITIYETDGAGNIIYDEVDGERIPRIKAERAGYNNPVPFDINVSAGRGSIQEDVFGPNVEYTRKISTTDLTLPIDELSIVWIESEPKFLIDGSVDPNSADYKVAAKPAKWKNSLVIALKAIQKGG